MSRADGSISGIDLEDPQPEDFFKIGAAHGQQGWPVNTTHAGVPLEGEDLAAYLEGHAHGSYKRPYLFPPTG